MDLLNLLGGRVEGDRKQISFSLLKDYDVAVLVDNSTRMLKQGRWDEVGRAVARLAPRVHKYNKRGIDVHFSNQQPRAGINLKTKSKAKKVFRETTLYFGQPIGAALNGLFNRFVQEFCDAGTEKRKREILVISDGMSSDDLGSALVGISKKLDELGWSEPQLTIQLVQVGNDPTATQLLRGLEKNVLVEHDMTDLVGIALCNGEPLTITRLEDALFEGVRRNQE